MYQSIKLIYTYLNVLAVRIILWYNIVKQHLTSFDSLYKKELSINITKDSLIKYRIGGSQIYQQILWKIKTISFIQLKSNTKKVAIRYK